MFSIYLQQADAGLLDAHDACGMSLMQKACNYGLHDHVQLMLDADMNPESVVAECATKPGRSSMLLLSELSNLQGGSTGFNTGN